MNRLLDSWSEMILVSEWIYCYISTANQQNKPQTPNTTTHSKVKKILSSCPCSSYTILAALRRIWSLFGRERKYCERVLSSLNKPWKQEETIGLGKSWILAFWIVSWKSSPLVKKILFSHHWNYGCGKGKTFFSHQKFRFNNMHSWIFASN